MYLSLINYLNKLAIFFNTTQTKSILISISCKQACDGLFVFLSANGAYFVSWISDIVLVFTFPAKDHMLACLYHDLFPPHCA